MDTSTTLSTRAKRLYGDTKTLAAQLQVMRPYICPFEEIIPLVPKGARLLDAGCGAGLFLGLLADCGVISSGTGFDSSESAIALAKKMTTKLPESVDVDIRHIDATAAWPSELYDVVSLVDVLHHVPPDAHTAVLSQAANCVRVGGILLYKDMATRPRWRAACNQTHDLLMARQWIHHVPIGFVETWARGHGMKQIAAGNASRYWYAHEWRVFQRVTGLD